MDSLDISVIAPPGTPAPAPPPAPAPAAPSPTALLTPAPATASGLSPGLQKMAQLMDCLGLPNDDAFVAKFVPTMQLERAAILQNNLGNPPQLSADVDPKDAVGVIVNTFTAFSQRRYTLFIKRGSEEPVPFTYPLSGGLAQLKVSGDLFTKLHFDLLPQPGSTSDVSLNVFLVKIPPPTPSPAATSSH